MFNNPNFWYALTVGCVIFGVIFGVAGLAIRLMRPFDEDKE